MNPTANERELILKEEVYAVVSCAIEVLNIRGHGLHEKIYENCLCVEFRLRGIPYMQQERHRVLYKGEIVGEYVPDLVAQEQLIVDTKIRVSLVSTSRSHSSRACLKFKITPPGRPVMRR